MDREILVNNAPSLSSLTSSILSNTKWTSTSNLNSHELEVVNRNPPARSPSPVPPASPSQSHGVSPAEEDPSDSSDSAGIIWLRRLWQNTSELDGLEQLLKESAENDAFARNLLHDYSQFKNSPAALLFLNLVQVYIIQPSSTSPVLKPLDMLEANASFSTALDSLFDSLDSADNQALRFW